MKLLKLWLVILACLFLAGPASATIINLTQTHGETWVKFAWAIDSADYGTDKYLSLYLDGTQTFRTDLNATPPLLVAKDYYLTDLKPNEQHYAKLVLVDNSTIPPSPLDSKSLQVMTNQTVTYYYIILALILILLFLSLIMARNRYETVAVVFNVGAVIFSAYLAIATQESNKAFSGVAILLTVVSSAILILLVYEIIEDKKTWSD